MRYVRLVFLALLCICPDSPASAGLVITIEPPTSLAPDTVTAVPIYVSGGDLVTGLNLYAEIGGGTTGPKFSTVDFTSTGMVFQDASEVQTGVYGPSDNNRYAYATVDIAPSTVSAGTSSDRQLLGYLYVDTTGVSSGSYDLKLNNMNPEWVAADTDFAGNVPGGTITPTFLGDGQLNINGGEEVPEPASLLLMAGLMACGAPAVVAYRRRKRIATAC